MDTKLTQPAKKFNWFSLFWEGVTHMSILGKTLWIVVIIKLMIMFGILKPFFFPDFLNSKYQNDKDKAAYVIEQLIDRTNHTP